MGAVPRDVQRKEGGGPGLERRVRRGSKRRSVTLVTESWRAPAGFGPLGAISVGLKAAAGRGRRGRSGHGPP